MTKYIVSEESDDDGKIYRIVTVQTGRREYSYDLYTDTDIPNGEYTELEMQDMNLWEIFTGSENRIYTMKFIGCSTIYAIGNIADGLYSFNIIEPYIKDNVTEKAIYVMSEYPPTRRYGKLNKMSIIYNDDKAYAITFADENPPTNGDYDVDQVSNMNLYVVQNFTAYKFPYGEKILNVSKLKTGLYHAETIQKHIQTVPRAPSPQIPSPRKPKAEPIYRERTEAEKFLKTQYPKAYYHSMFYGATKNVMKQKKKLKEGLLNKTNEIIKGGENIRFTTDWQEICRVVGDNTNLEELRRITETVGLPTKLDGKLMGKPALCIQLAQNLEQVFYERNCTNLENVAGDEIRYLPESCVLKEDGYCFDVSEVIDNEMNHNPYNRQPLSGLLIRESKKNYDRCIADKANVGVHEMKLRRKVQMNINPQRQALMVVLGELPYFRYTGQIMNIDNEQLTRMVRLINTSDLGVTTNYIVDMDLSPSVNLGSLISNLRNNNSEIEGVSYALNDAYERLQELPVEEEVVEEVPVEEETEEEVIPDNTNEGSVSVSEVLEATEITNSQESEASVPGRDLSQATYTVYRSGGNGTIKMRISGTARNGSYKIFGRVARRIPPGTYDTGGIREYGLWRVSEDDNNFKRAAFIPDGKVIALGTPEEPRVPSVYELNRGIYNFVDIFASEYVLYKDVFDNDRFSFVSNGFIYNLPAFLVHSPSRGKIYSQEQITRLNYWYVHNELLNRLGNEHQLNISAPGVPEGVYPVSNTRIATILNNFAIER